MKPDTTQAVEVKDSPIEGKGIFAAQAFARDERIIEYTGAVRRWSDYEDSDVDRVCLMGLGGEDVIDPRISGNEARYINHCCDPNCEAVIIRGKVMICANRAIAPGEELTMDYNLLPPREITDAEREEFACNCGAANCRGTMLAE